MKTIKRIGVLFMAIAISSFALSCSSSDDGGDGGNAAQGTIKAKINGSSFTSNKDFTTATKISAVGTLTIQGSDNSGKEINLTLNGVDGAGTYEIGSGVGGIAIIASYTEANASNPMNSQSWQAPFDSNVAGEIKISELTDSKVVGTFYFTAKNSNDNSTKEVTEGSFNVNINTY